MKTALIVCIALVVVLVGGLVYLSMTKDAMAPAGDYNGGTAAGTPPPAGTVAGATGRAVFSVTDAAAGLENLDSVLITVTEVRVHSAAKGWVTVSEERKQFDLLKLKSSGALALLADVNLEAGSYDQVRLTAKDVLVVEKGGASKPAKLPSGDLRINGKFLVKADATKSTSVSVDFLVDQSLHTTGKGLYIFAPVMKFEGRSNADVKIAGGLVDVKEGDVDGDITVGMNENGEIGVGLKVDAKANLDIVGDVIRIKTEGESETGVKVTAAGAIEAAQKGGYIDVALSVKMASFNEKKAWLVVGTKSLDVVTVYVDVVTGAVLQAQ